MKRKFILNGNEITINNNTKYLLSNLKNFDSDYTLREGIENLNIEFSLDNGNEVKLNLSNSDDQADAVVVQQKIENNINPNYALELINI